MPAEGAPPGPALGRNREKVLCLNHRYLTRHGIIAGSTGTGKSRAMQVMAEQLAEAGINVFVSDVKGDASGFCEEGRAGAKGKEAPFSPHALRANYWSLSDRFACMRFSLAETGPVLLARLLELNSTQESHLVLAFSHARKSGKRLDTVDDLLALLEGMAGTPARGMSGASISVIERKLLSLQESGLDSVFGTPSLRLSDLDGLNVLNLSDSRRNMLAAITPAFLLQKLFSELPETGDLEKPRYAVFFDEAHYLFRDANRSLRNLIVTILRQIRSKGVAVFFITQDVADLPEEVLSQLSTKIIFAQRIATAKGESALKSLSRSFPKTAEFEVAEELKCLRPGMAIVTALDSDGRQAPPAKVEIFAPATSMEVVPDSKLRTATDPELLSRYSAGRHAPAKRKQAGTRLLPERRTGRKTKEKQGGVFPFMLKLLDFFLKAGGKMTSALLIKPMQGTVLWFFSKPKRMLCLLGLLLLLYVLSVNWGLVQHLLGMLRIAG